MNSQEKSDITKRVQLEKLKRGEWISTEPFGYTRDYANFQERGNNPIFIEEDQAAIVRMCFELYDSGAFTQRSLIEEIQSKSPFQLSRGQIYNVLRNKFYCGIMEVYGVSYPHIYGNIIPQDLFNRVQSRLNDYVEKHKLRRKTKSAPVFRYRGIFSCSECNGSITGDQKKKRYIYYSCTNFKKRHKRKYFNEEGITISLKNKLKELHIYTEISDLMSRSELKVQHIALKNIFSKMSIDPIISEVRLTPHDIWLQDKSVAYEKLEHIIRIATEVPTFKEVVDQPTIFEPESLEGKIYHWCKTPKSFDYLAAESGAGIIELQIALMDLQLKDRLIETGPACYKSK